MDTIDKQGLAFFGILAPEETNRQLIPLIAKHFPDRPELGAMILHDKLRELAQKCAAIDDGRSGGFWLRDPITQDAFDILCSQGMHFAVRRDGDQLRASRAPTQP